MYVYESIKDEIWRRPGDIVFREITVRFPASWDGQAYDLLVEIFVEHVSGQVHIQVKEDLENV